MRSLSCIIIDNYLSLTRYKKMTNNPVKVLKYIEKCRKTSAKPYNRPQSKFTSMKTTVNGMEVFSLNQQHNTSQKQVLYLHGGSYIEQPVVQHWQFLDMLIKNTGAAVIVPIYPKAPDHQFMESIDNLTKVYSDMIAKTDPSNIVFMGDSSGGGLALAFAQYLLTTDMPQPKEIVLMSPWLDIATDNPDMLPVDKYDRMLGIYGLVEMGKVWVGDTSNKNPLVSPIFGEIKGLGHITLFVGTYEVFIAYARKFYQRAKKQNVNMDYYEYQEMQHVFPLLPISEAKKAQQQIANIVNGK